MGAACAKNAQTAEERAEAERAAELDRQMLVDKLHELFKYKILLLGAGESGKSTIVKQFKLIHNKRPTDKERKQFGNGLHTNVLECLQAIGQACKTFGYALTEEEQQTYDSIGEFEEKKRISPEFGEKLLAMYNGEAFRKAYARRNEYWLLDACDYYMQNLQRFTAPNFKPSDEDMLMARVRTTGIINTQLEQKRAEVDADEPESIEFQVVDVGGQRNERKKWMHCFDDVKCILFIVSLAGYNQVLFEDANMNRMEESLNLFEQTAGNDMFRHTPIFLFLNKKDLFEQMLRETPLSECKEFADYKGSTNVMESLKFIEEKFKERMAPAQRDNLYVEYVTGVAKKDVQGAFATVKRTLLKLNDDAVKWAKAEIRKEQKANKKKLAN